MKGSFQQRCGILVLVLALAMAVSCTAQQEVTEARILDTQGNIFGAGNTSPLINEEPAELPTDEPVQTPQSQPPSTPTLEKPEAPQQRDYTIVIGSRSKLIPPLEIKAGDTVTWKNEGERTYVLGDNSRLWKTKLVRGGEFSYQYNTPGEYAYRDVVIGLQGKIIVE